MALPRYLGAVTFEDLLHPAITKAALRQLTDGHVRDATVNAVVALFDLIRSRTGLTIDGVDRANTVFSAQRPYLVVGDLNSESGRNAQLGAMSLLRGLYQGVRSPTVHTVEAQIDPTQAARYLVVASALAHMVDEAKHGDILRFDGVYATEQGDSGDFSFFRFFATGELLRVSISGPLEDDWVPNWLTLDWAHWQGKEVNTYEHHDNRVLFYLNHPDGSVRCEGRVLGPTLKLRVETVAEERRYQHEYVFRPFPRRVAEALAEK